MKCENCEFPRAVDHDCISVLQVKIEGLSNKLRKAREKKRFELTKASLQGYRSSERSSYARPHEREEPAKIARLAVADADAVLEELRKEAESA